MTSAILIQVAIACWLHYQTSRKIAARKSKSPVLLRYRKQIGGAVGFLHLSALLMTINSFGFGVGMAFWLCFSATFYSLWITVLPFFRSH